MKIKKYIIISLIILLMPISMLFGCERKKPKLLAYSGENLIESQISLQLPLENSNDENSGGEVLGEDETLGENSENDSTTSTENDPRKIVVRIEGENRTKAYKNGLDFSFNKPNIYLQISTPTFSDNCYTLEFTALTTGQIDVTIKTTDNKMQTTLSFDISQDIEKIELNANSKNYVVIGESKAINVEQLINFSPKTTTKRDIELSLCEFYEGVTLENNVISIDKDVTNLQKICLRATSTEFYSKETVEEKQKLVVEEIYFDVISSLKEIVITESDGTNNLVEKLTLLTNSSTQNEKEFFVKNKTQDAFKNYLNIEDEFELKVEIESEYQNFVLATYSFEENVCVLTIKQNMKIGTAKIKVYAQNTKYPDYKSSIYQFDVEVLNAPTGLMINGNRNNSSLIIYDTYSNNLGEPLTFEIIGASTNLDAYISINLKEAQNFNLVNSFGIKADLTNIKSGTTLYLSANSESSVTETLITASVKTTNVNVSIELENRLEIHVVKNLADVTIKDEDNRTNNFVLSKIDEFGNSPTLTLSINKLPEDSCFKSYEITIEDENIVKVVENNDKNIIELKSLTVGSTNVKIEFDNGLTKEFNVSVFMPVDEIQIDFSEQDKQTVLGKINYINSNYEQIYVKTGERLEFRVKKYYKNQLVQDGTILKVDYSDIQNNNSNIAIDNISNILTAITDGQNIKIKPKFTCYNEKGEQKEILVSNFGENLGELLIDVYIPIKSISLNKEFFTLYTENNLGYFDKDLSSAKVTLNIEPSNASYKMYVTNPIACSVGTDASVIEWKEDGDVKNIIITAKSLSEKNEELDTISFTVREFDTTKTVKAYIRVIKAQQPQTIMVKNTEEISDGENTENAIYFTAGEKTTVKLNPTVYPETSYNTTWRYVIENENGDSDCIVINENGEVSAIANKSGTCKLILIPTASFTSETEYKKDACKVIYVTVADGSKSAPYLIRSAKEFFEIRSNLDKHFVLASDIDLSNYMVNDIITNQETFLPLDISYNYGYSLNGFTGSLNGEREVGSVKVSYSISGINIIVNPGMLMNDLSGNYYGLFAKNMGSIENLTVYYSNVSGIVTASKGNYSLQANKNYTFNFGGISATNFGTIKNCKTTIYNFSVESYFGNNFVGGISATNKIENENSGVVEKCKVLASINLFNISTVYAKNAYVGGLVGLNESEILDNFDIYNPSTEFNGKSSVNFNGIILSENNNQLSSWDDSGFGGISGKNAKTIKNCSTYGTIQAKQNIGGISGQNEGKIISSTSFSTILGENNVGGLVGLNQKTTEIKYSAVMLLDDENEVKIKGANNVGGIIGLNEAQSLTFEYNFIKSYSPTRIDMIISTNSSTFAGIIGYSTKDVSIKNSFANFNVNLDVSNSNYFASTTSTLTLTSCCSKLNGTKVTSESGTFTQDGEILRLENQVEVGIVGIFEPSEIIIKINNTTLNSQTINTPNKFIKADENTILLYYYNSANTNLNKYLVKALFDTILNYPNNTASQFSAIQTLVSNTSVAEIEGNYLIVKKTGNITLTIQSLLNKEVKAQINIIVINKIDTLNIFANEQKLNNSLTIKTGDSFKLSFNEEIYQDNVYVELTSSSDNISLNNSTISNKKYDISTSFIIKGETKGISTLTVNLYYKTSEGNFVKLPVEKSLTLVVGQGLSEFNLDINENSTLTLAPNSVINFNAIISSDVLASTNLVVKIFEVDSLDEINFNDSSSNSFETSVIKTLKENKSYFNISAVLKENNKLNKVYMALIANDELYSFNTIVENPQEFERYIKILEINITHNTIYSVDMSFYSNAETFNDTNLGNITNVDEVESKYINIGKVGLLKLNVYPISNYISSVELTYSNEDNLKLSINQLAKTSLGYLDNNKAENITNGIKFNFTQEELEESDGYLYAKLLTPAPIKEDSEYNLYCKLNFVDGTSLTFTKKLYTRLASSLEISYDNAVLINSSELVGVYAKSATNEQVVKLTVNRLQGFGEPVAHTSIPGVELAFKTETKISNETTVYEYTITGLNASGITAEIYFTLNKTISNKTEVVYSNILKLTTVDFVVQSVSVESVIDGIFYKPYGTKYNLNVVLNTINNGSSETIAKINSLQTSISKEIGSWWENQNKLEIKDYGDFEISKENGNLFITPSRVNSGNSLTSAFIITYNKNGTCGFKTLSTYPNKAKEHAYSSAEGFYTILKNQFTLNFYLQTDMNNPIPVTTQEEFENMDTDGNYILLQDIVLENYEPLDLDIRSLDGNGYTISISSFKLNSEDLDKAYVGLFKSTKSTTILKNINLTYKLQSEEAGASILDLSEFNQVYFGGLVAENDGLIYNSSVSTYKSLNTEELFSISVNNTLNNANYISSFVAINNGYISNSQSELKLKVNRGLVGGFVALNNKTIVSSYYKNATLVLSGTNEATNKLGGFVQENRGTIKYCFVEGESRYNQPNSNGQYLSNKSLSEFCLMSPTNIGGFVHTNSGEIEDCYSNASIRGQSYSGGFVYENSGKISRSYSASLNDAENNTAHAPFIATKINQDLSTQVEKLINCFYLKTNASNINATVATGLTFEEFKNEYYLTNFVFEEDYGVYYYASENSLPTLVEARNIAKSRRTLYNTQENQNGSLVYNYVYTINTYGSKQNPIIISSEDEFLYYFSNNLTTRISNYYRLICDIDFSEYSVIPSVDYTFSGRLDGNGMKIDNLSISAKAGYEFDSFGLFNKIEKNTTLTPIVKNLTISPEKVHANNVSKVGTLAGICEDGIIINVKVDASGVIVQGKNIVGGVVGEIVGDSKLINVSSNISVNAGYEKADDSTLVYNSENTSNNTRVSYAGAIAGAVNINEYKLSANEPIRNIEVSSKVKAIGEFTGLAFGGIFENSGVDNIKVYVDETSYINSLYASGVIAGENRGYISRAQAINLSNEDLKLFKNEVRFIGGIVGFNNNGTIVNSTCDVPVVSENEGTIYAGGICGVTLGGAFSGVIATNKVDCHGTVGGLIGLSAKRQTIVANFINDIESSDKQYKINLGNENTNAVKENSVVFISNCLALNKFSEEKLKNCLTDVYPKEGQAVGGIVGATSTTGELVNGTYTNYININYIYNNNYYIKRNVTTGENEAEITLTLNACGGTDAKLDAGKCYLLKTDKNGEGLATIEELATQVEYTKQINNTFGTWSSSIWNIKDNFISISENGVINSSIPTLKVANNINSKKLEGEGTYSSPYLISSPFGLVELANIVDETDGTIYAQLVDNIELTGKTIDVIGKTKAFSGTFNGNGYTINGLSYNSTSTNSSNIFGLFGNNSANGNIINTNVVANMIINCGRNVNRIGAIVANNKGYVSNCNVYGGIICILQNINNNYAEAYVGGIAGVNSGESTGKGVVYSKNYAKIYVASKDIEYTSNSQINVNLYVGGIVGLNTNKAVINVCENKTDTTSNLNGNYVIIARNPYGTNHLGTIYGYNNSSNTVQSNSTDKIYSENN